MTSRRGERLRGWEMGRAGWHRRLSNPGRATQETVIAEEWKESEGARRQTRHRESSADGDDLLYRQCSQGSKGRVVAPLAPFQQKAVRGHAGRQGMYRQSRGARFGRGRKGVKFRKGASEAGRDLASWFALRSSRGDWWSRRRKERREMQKTARKTAGGVDWETRDQAEGFVARGNAD